MTYPISTCQSLVLLFPLFNEIISISWCFAISVLVNKLVCPNSKTTRTPQLNNIFFAHLEFSTCWRVRKYQWFKISNLNEILQLIEAHLHKPGDQDSTVVVMDTRECIVACFKQLGGSTNYLQLDTPNISMVSRTIEDTIDEGV